MKIIFTFILTALMFPLAAQPAFAKDEWVRIKSKNFNIVGNANEKELRRVAGKLEQFREAFRVLLPNLRFDSPIPTTVIIFKNSKSFDVVKPLDQKGKPREAVGAYFLKSDDINYIALTTEGEKEQTYATIFHEYTHFLVDNEIGRSNLPPWLNEGLAEYYEKFRIEADKKVTLGALNINHLSLLAQSSLLSANTFFSTDYYSLNRQEIDRAGIFYAQSWAFVHYLLHSDEGERRAQLKKFIASVINGKAQKDAFEEAFKTDYGAMQAEVKKYIAQNRFSTLTATFSEKLAYDSEALSLPLEEAEAKAILGDLLYHARRFGDAETLLRQALALKPESVQANISLGLVKMRQKNPSEAKRLLKRAIELDDKSYLAHFQYAYALHREEMTESGFVSGYDKETADEIKSALKRSIVLNPGFAESYALYAFVSAVRNEDVDEALEFMKKALAVSPGNQIYLLRVAELFLRKEDFSAARVIAQKVFETASTGQMRLYAQNTLNNINSTEAQLAGIKNYRKGGSNPAIESEKPLTEEEIARRNREAVNEGLNRALRKPSIGEKRLLGSITRIDCAAGRIEFSVKTAAQTFKFFARDFESLFLMSFSSDSAETEIGCATVKKEILAVITYLPARDAKTAFAGEIVALEFMPEGFKLQ